MFSWSRWVLAMAVLFASAGPVAAETTVVFDGQVRVRLEGADRSFDGVALNWDALQRTRFGISIAVSPEVNAYLQVQDSRLWGTESNTLSNEENVDLLQGWAQVEKALSQARLRFRGGRQMLSYGNERIVGAVDWSNVGRSFDAMQIRLTNGHWTGDLVAAMLRDTGTASSNDALYMSYNQYAFPDRDLRGEFYVLYRNDPSGTYETLPGVHLDGKNDTFRFDVEVTGRLGTHDRHDLRGLMASGQAHLQVADRGLVSVGGGVDYYTGDDPDTGDDEFFDVGRLFATAHKFYGFMDIAPLEAGRAGLIDPYLALQGRGPRSTTAMLAGHFFLLDQPGQFLVGSAPNQEQETDRDLGVEIDLKVLVNVASQSKLELGGGVFLPGNVLDHQGRDEVATWTYAQGIVSF